MESTAKIFVSLLLLCCLCTGGNASYEYCKASDLKITQTPARGRHVAGGLHVYEVTVENTCACMQSSVKLACHGFNPSVHVDPAGFLRLDGGGGGRCILNGGLPIPGGHGNAVKFSYAWSSQLSLKPVSSTVGCSKSAVVAAPAPA